ncbi:hypothetical protein, partial [Parabacteroides distasonis]|uniref:hypothetical protein n=1 Tax=Parabacteroides distasonis TaxID=823 RepID=UPI001D087A84
ARFIAITDPAFMVVHFGTDPFDTVSPSFFLCNSTVFHGKRRVIEAGWIAISIVPNFLRELSFLRL